jgi:hypothetical protein
VPKRERLAQKQIHYDARRLRTLMSAAPGGTGPHALLGSVHNDTVVSAPVQGGMVLADSTPEWNILLHPTAAGYALVTDATDVAWDQTPTWTGNHTWDDGTGDSPALVFIGGSNDDTASIFLDDDAVAGNSDLVVKLAAADADAQLLIRDSGDADVAYIDADGNEWLNGNLTLDDGTSDSPQVQFVGGTNDDTISIYLADAGLAGDSDLHIRLCATDADSALFIQNSTPARVATIDALGNAGFSELVFHYADVDTYMQFQDDRITLRAGGVDLVDIVEGASDYVVVNSTTIDTAFVAAFHVTDGNVGISQDGDPAVLHQFAYGVAGTDYPVVRGRFARTSRAAPSAAQSGDLLARWGGGGYGATGFATVSTGRVQVEAAENFTDAAMGSHLDFYTTPVTTIVAQRRLRLAASGRVKMGDDDTDITGQVHIDQESATGALTVLYLEQQDTNWSFLTLHGTATNAVVGESLVEYADANGTGAVWAQVRVVDDGGQNLDGTYYMLLYSIAAP